MANKTGTIITVRVSQDSPDDGWYAEVHKSELGRAGLVEITDEVVFNKAQAVADGCALAVKLYPDHDFTVKFIG